MARAERDWEPITARANPMPREPMNPARPAKSTPCATCPFRRSNFGRITGLGDEWDTFFTAPTREKVWDGRWDPAHPESALRNGGLNHCHMTHAHACAGAVVLQQRELLRARGRGHHDLSEIGLERVGARMLGRSVSAERLLWLSMQELLDSAHPAITDDAIGHHSLARPSLLERRDWDPSPKRPATAKVAAVVVRNDRAHLLDAVRAVTEAAHAGARESRVHGERHWRDVARVGAAIRASGVACDPVVVFLFALLHDSQRENDGGDPDHGRRAAELAGAMFPALPQLPTLREALAVHNDGHVHDDATIGACWDADRLTLGRCGITPRPHLLSTFSSQRALTAAISWTQSEIVDAPDVPWTEIIDVRGSAPTWPTSFEPDPGTVVVYHGTSAANAERIRVEGLRPGPWRFGMPHGVWVTPDRAYAYGEHARRMGRQEWTAAVKAWGAAGADPDLIDSLAGQVVAVVAFELSADAPYWLNARARRVEWQLARIDADRVIGVDLIDISAEYAGMKAMLRRNARVAAARR